jgi:hypothetical protein
MVLITFVLSFVTILMTFFFIFLFVEYKKEIIFEKYRIKFLKIFGCYFSLIGNLLAGFIGYYFKKIVQKNMIYLIFLPLMSSIILLFFSYIMLTFSISINFKKNQKLARMHSNIYSMSGLFKILLSIIMSFL